MTQTSIRTFRTDELTVPVSNAQSVTFGEAEIRLIADRRNAAALHRNAGNARDEAFSLRGLREELAERLGVPQALIATALAAVRTDDLYMIEYKGRPEALPLAVRWERGWKTYETTGTRHAYYLLRKLASREGFQGARLNDIIVGPDGYQVDNVIHFTEDDITGSDRFGKYAALLNRNNSNYDLEH